MLGNKFLFKINGIQWVTWFVVMQMLASKMNSCQGSWGKKVGCLGPFLFSENYLFSENFFLGVGYSVESFLLLFLLTLF